MRWLEVLTQYAQSRLGDREREALYTRGVNDEQINLFRLGYLDQDLPQLDDGGLFTEKYRGTHWLHDSFVLPLTNTLGQVKGLQLRHVDVSQKGYSHFSPYEDEPVLFGLAQAVPHAWESRAIYLVEGGFDLFPIQRVCPNIIATLTNRLTDQVARTLRRFVDELWLAYDMDPKGREAVARVYKQHGQNFEKIHDIRFPRLPTLDGKARVKDPAELWEVWGDTRFREFLQRQ
jgi:DNA primase